MVTVILSSIKIAGYAYYSGVNPFLSLLPGENVINYLRQGGSEYSSSSRLLELKKARALISSSSCSIVLKTHLYADFYAYLLANCSNQ